VDLSKPGEIMAHFCEQEGGSASELRGRGRQLQGWHGFGAVE